MDTSEDFSDRRTAERQAVLVSAQMHIPGMPAIECEIRDVTPEGARLTPVSGDLSLLPEKFLLFVPGIGEVWAACVRWACDGAFGVKFLFDEADRVKAQALTQPDHFATQVQIEQEQLLRQ
ncbi:MAG: hypothetical protein ACLQIQ_09455 [Beijerinckiaceae bacterium]